MNKVILMSIRPEWLVKILNGEKTIEIRKTMPKCELPIDVYLYCTKGIKDILYKYKDKYYTQHYLTFTDSVEVLNSKVVAKFTLKWCDKRSIAGLTHSLSDFNTFLKRAGIDWYKNSKEFHDYVSEKDYIYAWHIKKLEIFDKPKELNDFHYYKTKTVYSGMDCPPYVDEVKQTLRKAPQSWQYVWVEGK